MQNTEAAAAFLGKRPLKRIPGDDIAEVENEEHTEFPSTFCADKAAGSSRDPFSVFSFFILPSLFFCVPALPVCILHFSFTMTQRLFCLLTTQGK
jgi:hypothetical protein